MKQKMSVKEQVAQLTPEQKKNIRKYELISGGITLLVCVPLFIFFISSYLKYMDVMNSDLSYFVKQAAHETFVNDYILFFVIAGVYLAIFYVVFFAVIKRKMPYYSMKKGFYLLTHKDAQNLKIYI